MKLEQIAPYLPYKLQIQLLESRIEPLTLIGISHTRAMGNHVVLENKKYRLEVTYDQVKPILRPLSDLTKDEMKELYFVVFGREFIGDNITHRDVGTKNERHVLWSGLERLFIYKDGDVGADIDLQYKRVLPFDIISFYASKHFDVFGLIESGEAIDINTLPKH